MLKQVEIFTDGSCLGNPGPGGYGAIMRYRQHEKTFSAGYRLTTNNRMELMAAIIALEALKEHCEVVLSTDSQYVRQGITQWIHNWKKRGWKTAEKKPVKNVDLWQRLDAALGQHKIKWEWVRATPAILKMNAATSWRARRPPTPHWTMSATCLRVNSALCATAGWRPPPAAAEFSLCRISSD